MKQDHAKCIPWCIYIMKPKRGLGNGTCIYTVSVTQSDQKIAGFIIKSPLPGGFLLPLQTTKENFFFSSSSGSGFGGCDFRNSGSRNTGSRNIGSRDSSVSGDSRSGSCSVQGRGRRLFSSCSWSLYHWKVKASFACHVENIYHASHHTMWTWYVLSG